MAWGTPVVGFTIAALDEVEQFLGASTSASNVYGEPISHNPGESTDLNIHMIANSGSPAVDLIMSVYASVVASPANRGDYSNLPISRFAYRPVDGSEWIFPLPLGRMRHLIIGYRAATNALNYNVHHEYVQNGINL